MPPGASSKRRGANSTRKISAEPESREEILVDASSILESAAATAYEHADNLTGPFAAMRRPDKPSSYRTAPDTNLGYGLNL
ncbi:hypothetical protein C3F00_026990 [Pseudomonas sp. MWU13-2860]|nr:hypothetical protein C3F00_026990 [Pseudomonas sp. MWU13-2860]